MYNKFSEMMLRQKQNSKCISPIEVPLDVFEVNAYSTPSSYVKYRIFWNFTTDKFFCVYNRLDISAMFFFKTFKPTWYFFVSFHISKKNRYILYIVVLISDKFLENEEIFKWFQNFWNFLTFVQGVCKGHFTTYKYQSMFIAK